jgi:hypothetical protein
VVVAKGENSVQMRLDGVLIPDSLFKPISGTYYTYAQIPMPQGTHTLTALAPFGVTIYGLGPVDSYAYVGGADLIALNAAAGVRDITQQERAMSLCPNPADGEVMIEWEGSTALVTGVEISDITGKIIYCDTPLSLQSVITFGTGSLSQGRYTVKMSFSDGTSTSRNLVIRR